MTCIISYLAIGNELLNGKTLNSNGHWLGKYLSKVGGDLKTEITVGDELEEIQSGIQKSLENASIVILSGGLGPTGDDKTKEGLALTFQRKLYYDEVAEKIVENHYKRKNHHWEKNLNNYPYIPQGSIPLENPVGLALGFQFNLEEKKFLISLPGVPREFQAMIEKYLPPLLSQFETLIKKRLIYRLSGIFEEDIFSKVRPNLWEELSQFGEVSSLPKDTGVDIGIECLSQELQVESEIDSLFLTPPLSQYLWQKGDLLPEEVIIKELINQKKTLGFVESCTGGLASSRLTDISGSSNVFKGSIISYAIALKEALLEIDPHLIKKNGAVSQITAKEMSKRGLEKLQTSYCISFTGLAGPLGDESSLFPVGTLFLSIAWKENSKILSREYSVSLKNFERKEMKNRFVTKAFIFFIMDFLRPNSSALPNENS